MGPKTLLTVPSSERRFLPGPESWRKRMKPESSNCLTVLFVGNVTLVKLIMCCQKLRKL